MRSNIGQSALLSTPRNRNHDNVSGGSSISVGHSGQAETQACSSRLSALLRPRSDNHFQPDLGPAARERCPQLARATNYRDRFFFAHNQFSFHIAAQLRISPEIADGDVKPPSTTTTSPSLTRAGSDLHKTQPSP